MSSHVCECRTLGMLVNGICTESSRLFLLVLQFSPIHHHPEWCLSVATLLVRYRQRCSEKDGPCKSSPARSMGTVPSWSSDGHDCCDHSAPLFPFSLSLFLVTSLDINTLFSYSSFSSLNTFHNNAFASPSPNDLHRHFGTACTPLATGTKSSAYLIIASWYKASVTVVVVFNCWLHWLRLSLVYGTYTDWEPYGAATVVAHLHFKDNSSRRRCQCSLPSSYSNVVPIAFLVYSRVFSPSPSRPVNSFNVPSLVSEVSESSVSPPPVSLILFHPIQATVSRSKATT